MAPARPVRLAVRPRELIGREDLLAELGDLLDEPRPLPRLIGLYGLGGVGKTSLAVELAYRRLSGYGLVWQFAAEDPTTLSAGFAELATLLGIRELGDPADPVAQVHAALADRDDRWLLLFDNATDAQAIRHALPPAGDGHVLVTSRSAHWPRAIGVEVPVLDGRAAAALLMARTGDDDADAAARAAAELGALPLALEQAAAYLAATGWSVRDYLRLLRERRADLLARGRPWGYDMSVASTWTLAFERLRDTDPEAITLLRILSCLAPDAIPITLLMSAQERPLAFPDLEVGALYGDDLAVGDAIAALRRYSLVGSPAGGVISVHRLVQAVTLDQLSDDERKLWRSAAAALVEAVLPERPDEVSTWPVYAVLLAHGRAALDTSGPGMRKIVNYLGASGDYVTAATVQGQIREDALRRLGPEHPDTLTAGADLAKWTGHAGNPLGARDMLATLVPIRLRVSGAEHPDTLSVQEALADWTGQAGDPIAARDMCAVLLPVRERVSGPDNSDTLRLGQDLGFWTGQAGDPASARDRYAALLPRMARVWGAEHPDTLAAKNQYARWLGEAGDPEAARDMFRELVSVYERVSGLDHPDALWVLAGLAWWTGQAGDAAAARDLHAELLPIRERVSGPEHHASLVTWVNLAYWTGQAGDPVAARDHVAALLPIRQRKFGPEHFDTLIAQENLAHWTGEAGDAADAAGQYAALLLLAERVLGPESSLVEKARTELAAWTARTDEHS